MTFKGYYVSPKIGLKNYLATLINFVIASIIIISIFGLTNGTNQETFVKQANKCKSNDCLTQSISSSWPQVTLTSIKTNETTTTSQDSLVKSKKSDLTKKSTKLDKYSTGPFKKRKLQQFNDDLGFNFSPQIDFARDFTRLNIPNFQSFPGGSTRGGLPPTSDDSSDYSDIEGFREIQPSNGGSQGFGQPASIPSPPSQPSVNFQQPPQGQPRQPSFQRVRLQSPPLPGRSPALDLPSVAFANAPSSALQNQPGNEPRFQRINVRQRLPNSPVSQPLEPARSPNQPFRRLPVFRAPENVDNPRRPVTAEELALGIPPASSGNNAPPPASALGNEFAVPSVTSAPLPTGPPRTRRIRPTAGGSRRIRPVGNRIRTGTRVSSAVDDVAPTAVVVNRPPSTPTPIGFNGEEVDTVNLERNPDSRRIRGSRRPVAASAVRTGSNNFRRRPVPLSPESVSAAEEEVIGNNALDAGDSVEAGFGSKIKDEVTYSAAPISPNGPIVVDYLTTFTYLTTVIRGPHTLLTSRESTASVRVTQPYDPSIAEIVSVSGGNIRPTRTSNLGTKTRGPTTTIVNVQSNVHIAGYSAAHVIPTRAPPLDFSRTRKPVIETAPQRIPQPVRPSVLRAEILSSVPKALHTEFTYFYTVHDGANTRRSTRSELTTAPVTDNAVLATLQLDTTVNADGFISLGSGPSTVNLGKRVFGGSTTEVNLAMRTYLKLDGISNVRIEPTATRPPSVAASEAPVRATYVPRQPLESSVPSLDSSTPVLESSFPSSAGETDATPSIGLSPSQSGTFIRSRRPIRVSSTAINPELIRSRVVTGRPGQRIRTRPNFNRLQRPRVSLEEPEATEVVGSGLESSNIASTPYLSEPVLEATASPVFNSEDIRSTPISSSVNSSMKRVAVTVRRPYGGDQLRSRLRRPFRPTETTEPKFLVVTRSGPVGLVRSTKSRFRVASRVVRPPGSSGESPQITPEVSSDISEPSVSVVSSIDPTLSSVLVTYFTTTTHTVPYTFNDKTHLTTIEVTNSRVATESLDSSVFVDKTNKLLASSALEPSSPVTFEPTLVTGAAVSMRDGLSSTDDLETRTVYTTYTYFTTYYNGPSSIISSSEQVVSNLVTVPRTEPLPIIPTSSDSSAPITVVETSEKIETSTIYSTYTYFATMFNGSRSVITPIEETRSEVLTLREPVRITRTINSTRSTAIRPPDSSIFSRTYFTTYTKFLTYGDADSKSTSATEEVVSNVVTFTLPNGPQSTPPLDRIYTTETINQLSAFSSLLTTKSTHTTLTHFITLFSGTQTILSSIEEVSPTVVTQYVGATEGPTQKDTRRVNGQNIRLTQADAESLKSSRDLMTALIPSISTLHVTHTYYTTFFNGHTSIVASRTEATSSLVTLYVPNSSAQRPSSSSDQVITMYKSADPAAVGGGLVTSYATVGSTPTAPLPSSVAFDRHHHQHKPGEYEGASLSVQPSLRLESSRVDQLESSIISRVVENLKSSQGLSEDQISSVILNAASGIGKSTTVIGGSTVVFFPDLVFKPSTSDSINPTKNSGTNGESTIKPGTVIELSDLLGGGSNINLAGGLGDTIKDIVHLIAQNAAKANKTNENVDRIESSKVNFPQGGVTLTHDADPIYIPLGGKAKSNETDGERAYQPEFGIEAGEDGAPSGSGNDDLGTYGGYQRKNDVYLRNNKPDLNGLEGSQIQPTSASSETPLLSTSSPDGVYSQVSSGATTIFFGTDALESGQLAPTAGDSASPSVTSTRFVTSVENLTRTLTLTTTKVYYTRDSPLTITSVLTTTIPPRTFVSTIIGSRTITGTAGDPTKTVAVEPATSIDDESTTTVTTTTLIFNSITTTVVRTLVIPTSGIEPTKPVTTRVPVTQRPSRRPYTPFRAPQRPTTPPPSKRKGNDKPSVNIRPPGSRTRSPYLPKRPVTPPPSATVSSIGDEDSRSSTTPRPMTTPKIIDDDQCRPACSNKQVCKENGGVFRCECRPGFTKKEGSDKCEEMQSYIVVVKLMKVGESSVLYRTELADSASNEYQKIAKLAKEEIDKAYRNTTIKENYIGANVNGINKTSSGDDGVLVNLTVHLASRDDLDEDILKSELSKSLIDTESLPSPSSITADVQAVLDFDECSDNKYNDCDPAAYCINRPGSYRCECKGPYTDMDPSVPGRHCSSEIKNCEACHGRGDCVRSEDGERTTCKCQRMYLGERCEINGLLLATFLPIAAILSIVCVCCIVYCCRKYKKKNNYPKGFKNIVAFAPPTIGANTLDRKAMLETSSESSEHFRHAQHDGTNTIGGYPSGNGSTRRHMSHEMSLDRSLGPVGGGSFIAMPPQVTIPRARHINQSTESQQDSPTTTATKMDPDSLERRKSTPDTPTDDSLPPTNFKRVFRSQTRPTPKFDMRSESRAESRSFHRTDHHSDKDFIEWTPSKRYDQNHHHQQQQQQQQNESLRSNQSLSKTLKSYKGLADLRIGHFDWQWKMLRNGHGSYSPNDNRRKKKSVSEVNPSFDLSLRDSPSTSSSQRFPESSEIMMEDHKNEKEESVASYSTTWTGGPAQYHLADDLISLERRSQVSNWGRLPFYDN